MENKLEKGINYLRSLNLHYEDYKSLLAEFVEYYFLSTEKLIRKPNQTMSDWIAKRNLHAVRKKQLQDKIVMYFYNQSSNGRNHIKYLNKLFGKGNWFAPKICTIE